MAAKCPKCGSFVSKKGELCTLCKYQSMGSQGGQSVAGDISGMSKDVQIPFEGSFTDGKMIEGIVRNYVISPGSDVAVSRWMKSFLTGVPFTMDSNRISFNVIDTESLRKMGTAGVNSAYVQIYGAISAGDICNGQTVKVWGKKDTNNVWYATRIQNSLTGVVTTFSKCMPALVVRIITVLIFLLPIFLIIAMGGMSPQDGITAVGMLQPFIQGLIFVGKIILLLASGIFGYKLFKVLNQPMSVLGVVLLVLFCLLFPELGIQIGVIVLTVFVLLKLVVMLFK